MNTRPFRVDYFWVEDGKRREAHTVENGRDLADAERRFQARARHVSVFRPGDDAHMLLPIGVRQAGSTYTARAGHGKGVKTASCTSDGLTAALRAAAKWFDLPESQIVVARTTERGYTARPIRAHEVFTEIEFEDRGQDFIRWTVAGDGTVYDCQPCQSWVWCGGSVLNLDALRVGGLVKFASYQDSITVAYRIVNLNRRDASS